MLVAVLGNSDSNRKIEVVLLNSDENGIEQISETLLNRHDLDAIYIISHGDDGTVNLVNTSLNANTLADNNQAIARWADSFAETGDILMYGCNLAETQVGRNLINNLSHLTLTDVAASNNLTGKSILGGDLIVEFTTGTVETANAISTQTQQIWKSLLAETIYESNETIDEALIVDNSNTWIQSFHHTSGAGSYDVNSVSIWLKETGATAQTVTVSLRSGAYNGSVLASASIGTSSLNNSITRHDLDLSTSVTLSDNVAYYLRVENPTSDGNIFLGSEENGTYSQGLLLNSGISTVKDMAFGISQQPDTTTGLEGHWTFDADANDSSGNANHGILSGGAFINTAAATNQVGAGKLSLDGVNDHVDLSTHTSSFSGYTEGTIVSWVFFTNTGLHTIFSISDTANNGSFATLSIDNGKLFFGSMRIT